MSKQKCVFCGEEIEEGQNFCSHCGARIDQEIETDIKSGEERIRIPPQSIDDLKRFCAANGMPLEQMRFFIGEDYKGAKAFGIYQDGDRFVVYKNKADGSRSVRYQGADECFAVQELYAKLLDECHARGIYPDGAPEQVSSGRRKSGTMRFILLIIIAFVVGFTITVGSSWLEHRHDGYYAYGNDTYYLYGDDWYYYDLIDFCWIAANSFPFDDYNDYYLGDDYESGWEVEDFRNSDVFSEIRENEAATSSSDYSSWDSDDTDWDSDW